MAIQNIFKLSKTLDQRKKLSREIKEKFTNRVPVILSLAKNANGVMLDRYKFLAPVDVSAAVFLNEIRKYLSGIDASQSIFLLTEDEKIVNMGENMISVYEKHAEADGFLYIVMCLESSYGY